MLLRCVEYIKSKLYEMKMKNNRKLGFYSQCGQDRFIIEHFKYKKDGFFIEIGANDGVCFSNTKYLEELGWAGACIEPDPEMYAKLCQNRTSKNFNVAIGDENATKIFTKISGPAQMLSGLSDDYDEEHIKRIDREIHEFGGKKEEIAMEVRTLDFIMNAFENVNVIDYISIDTEGNEFKIIKSLDFEKYDIRTISVENNYLDGSIISYMNERGYLHHKLYHDDIFIKR